MVEATAIVEAPVVERPGRFKVGQKVYVDRTPMRGTIVKIDHSKKHGWPTRYYIKMKGWPKPIKRKESDISSTPDYLPLYADIKWNLNPKLERGNWPPYNVAYLVRNIQSVFRSGDITKLSKGTYQFIVNHMSFIAHYSLLGFQGEYRNLREFARTLQTGELSHDLNYNLNWAFKTETDRQFNEWYGPAYNKSVADGIRGIVAAAREYLRMLKNPQEKRGGIITLMGIMPTKPGLYLTTNRHDCPEKTKILITIYPDGTFSTYCSGCGESPVVFYEGGQFTFLRGRVLGNPRRFRLTK